MLSALATSDTSSPVDTEPTVANLRTDFERIARQMYSQNLALVQTNRTLSILRAIDLLILESSRDLQQLSTEISQAIIDESPYPIITILTLNQHADKQLAFQGYGVAQFPGQPKNDRTVSEIFKKLSIPLDGQWVSGSSRNLIINLADKEQVAKLSTVSENANDVIRLLCEHYNLKSIYITKLKARDSLTGIMLVGLEESVPMIDDIELIERVSEPTGIAIDNRLLYDENIRIVRQLQQTNDRLKEIDASKDEFISMASHQLRTPLTSMKGYVSMVLDGDMGPITEQQRGMLQQAYDSSQRMVYLIADLLNVSRLRTGKFIISNKVTDLAQVIDDELKQLTTTAKARNVNLIYNKPTNIPKLLIDETKVRQVVMNFLDNALYYTPSGGRVTIELTANEKSISYMVTDDGLGVPKEEQKYLFTKFYRAKNARKIRPDGTGLGLYMARKIIIAQGGAILFRSTENEGSTFGFSFPLEKVIAPTEIKLPQTSPSEISVPHL